MPKIKLHTQSAGFQIGTGVSATFRFSQLGLFLLLNSLIEHQKPNYSFIQSHHHIVTLCEQNK